MNMIKLKVVSFALLTAALMVPGMASPASADEIVRTDADDTDGYLNIAEVSAGHGKATDCNIRSRRSSGGGRADSAIAPS